MSLIHKLEVNSRWLISHIMKVYVMGCKPVIVDDLEILHLSDNFLVVNKQCDIAINSESSVQHPVTVATQLNHKFKALSDPSVKFGFRFCHRLDYSTSGVLCIALNKNAAKQSYLAMSSKKSEKYYLALVYGHVQSEHLIVDKPIGYDSRQEYSHCMCTADKEYCINPRWAVSRLLVLQHGFYNGSPASKLLLKLITGRRHQLRVHCHELGHTIIGDYTYSNRKDISPYRMFLHSYRLVLPSEMENLDVSTNDPFTENDSRNKWCPVQTFHNLNDETFTVV
ncbi:RNA pseudouridylate synthase domain-containing protein 1-like isoform X2 [Stegodyphus dumicola]|nr:RNA pseudouridylate synthase domain-containing protein 1-like isoform X2 [Stegodyphus dumicola]XP_035226879.1 RNA pseudouridylate synthase domain-containing protein 1-like isoform X2 [Stegodyphus dumicola]